MYSKVIVPLDGSELSEQALPFCQLVARSMSVPIELVEAYDILPPAVHDRHTSQVVSEMLSDARRRSETYLTSIRESLEAAGNAASVSMLYGAPADAIVALASADPDALVVMSTHGRGGIARWALGSVADKVLHTVSNPMLIVRANAAHPASADTSLKTVLVPLDGSGRAELSLPHAAGMAAALTAPISLLRVTPTADYYRHHLSAATLRMGAAADSAPMSANEMVDADAGEVSAYLSGVKGRLAVNHVHEVATYHQQSQNVAQVIIDKAMEQPSLVVMTTHGRSGIGRLVLGSVTDRVVCHSSLPVLVIR